MGTVLEIRLCAPDRARGRRWLEEGFAEAERLERIFSSYDPASDLSRVNARAGLGATKVPSELARIAAESLALGQLTRGAFDISVGPWVELWRSAAQSGALPDAEALGRTRGCVGAERVRVDREASTIELLSACSALELGGIAKGWTLDRLVERLVRAGVSSALLDFGGSSLAALGAPADAPHWRVWVPDAGELELRDESLSVSASLGQSLEIGGRRYGHVIDPRSGEPLDEPRVAWVVTREGARAEALSKALLILGPAEGLALLERLGDARGAVVEASGAP